MKIDFELWEITKVKEISPTKLKKIKVLGRIRCSMWYAKKLSDKGFLIRVARDK